MADQKPQSQPNFIPADPDFLSAGVPTPTENRAIPKLIGYGSDLLQGIGEGALNTVSGTSKLINKIPYFGEKLAPKQGIHALDQIATPDEGHPLQNVGRIGEQTAEFFVPGPEEARVMKGGSRLAKLGYQALKGGVQNKLQGGSFTTGTVAGAGGEGLAQGAEAVAPHLAEAALNIRKLDRAYKPSGAIGKETLNLKGVRPSTIAENARGKLDTLDTQLENAVDKATASGKKASLNGARDVMDKAKGKATAQGEKTTVEQLDPMAEHLERNRVTGVPHTNPIVTTNPAQLSPSGDVTPRQLLDMKRGFGNEFIHRWNPETMEGVKGTAGQTYHALDSALDAAVPESQATNEQIANLIPIAKRAEGVELNAPTAMRVAHRVAAHTGALAGTVTGGLLGYEHGGTKGALMGAGAGLLAPELIASPTGEMIMAKGLKNFRLPATAAKGGLLQLDRDSVDKKKSQNADQ